MLFRTFWASERLFEKMTFWVTFWAKPVVRPKGRSGALFSGASARLLDRP
jgi:hypothetical protein